MVTRLLHVDHGTVLAIRLMRLTKDRIQRLLKDLFLDEEGQVVDHDELHSLNRVANRSCLIQIYTHGALERWHDLQDRDWCTTLDRKTDLGNIKIATEQLFADHADNLCASTSQFLQKGCVCALEPTPITSVFSSEITREGRWHELLCHFSNL